MTDPEVSGSSERYLQTDRPLRIAVDTKNLALYTGGIAAFFGPLLRAWISQRPQHELILVGPPFEASAALPGGNWSQHILNWPSMLPRPLRHPIYDNVIFPRAMQIIKPDVIFTPYHDVRLPRGVPSVMMVHDTCLHDLPDVYPLRIRGYYLHMLKRNLAVVDHVLTVSQTSRRDLQERYGVTDERSAVVPNAIDPQMTQSATAPADAMRLRADRGTGLHLFYPGGSEHRKNIRNLALAVAELDAGRMQPALWITGPRDEAWTKCLSDLPAETRDRFFFLGRISLNMLAAQYLACDVVVYPTLCEGFGRVALEAMELGVPLACSNIGVLKEVASEYPTYFNPQDPVAIAAAIQKARYEKTVPYHCAEFQPEAVTQKFLNHMDSFVAKYTR